MTLLESANALTRFALELCALAALAYWGVATADGWLLDLVLGLGAPLIFALIWGAFVAPKAPFRLDDPLRLIVEVTVFAFAVLALIARDAVLLGLILGLAVVANIVFMVVLDQRRRGGI